MDRSEIIIGIREKITTKNQTGQIPVMTQFLHDNAYATLLSEEGKAEAMKIIAEDQTRMLDFITDIGLYVEVNQNAGLPDLFYSVNTAVVRVLLADVIEVEYLESLGLKKNEVELTKLAEDRITSVLILWKYALSAIKENKTVPRPSMRVEKGRHL